MFLKIEDAITTQGDILKEYLVVSLIVIACIYA